MLHAATDAISTPLAELHRSAGAHLGVWFGCSLPDDFGDWRAEYHFARESVALLDKSYRAYFDFTGPDRVRYLNAILTNNIKDLRENHGVASLFLNPQGHIQAEIETYALAGKLFAVSFAMIRERLIAALDKYIIMDDVTLTDRTADYATLALEGPQASAITKALANVDISSLAPLEFRETTMNSNAIPCRVTNRSSTTQQHGSSPSFSVEFLVERAQAPALWQALQDAVRTHGGGPAGYTALNALRLEQGVPWFSYDFGEKQIPHEAGLQDSHISYTKGCYTGQEIVERVRSRGQINRTRVTMKIDATEPPATNTPLLSDGKEFGYTTRAAFSPALNAVIAAAYLRREKSAPDSQLTLPTGATATVILPPLK
ncbi:MAG TPA: aminomethyltransferase family protein [Candidatus Acidoferrum sp.]